MTLKKIRIENIKGISDQSFELEIIPNRPSLLVAPNGFGKSSFATAFLSLQTNRISVHEDHHHQNDSDLQSKLSLEYKDGDGIEHSLIADSDNNSITNHFSWFVINNQIKAKGVGRSFGGRTSVSASIAVEPVTLIDTIPEREDFNYSYRTQKNDFGVNGKVLSNITDYFNNLPFISSLSECYTDLDRISQVRNKRIIEQTVSDINEQLGNSEQLVEWIANNKSDIFAELEPLNNISNHIMSSNLGVNRRELAFLVAIQIYSEYSKDKTKFKKAVKYSNYKLEKDEYRTMLEAFNSSWCQIRPKEKGRKLIVEFPKANHISNGQRDVITFVALLYRAQRKLTGLNAILVIDEVFDYLDDANLVAVQYYITKLIDKFKSDGRRLYPLILTHLNPYYFKNFAFSKQKVYYLDKRDIEPNQAMVKLLRNRNEVSIKDDVSKYLLHYHPNQINKRAEFHALGLRQTWGEGDSFYNFINGEARKYIDDGAGFDPLAVCCAVRVAIENHVYQQLVNNDNKQCFISTFKTREKLLFAEDLGASIPEYFYLLGVIYNDGMHWREGQDNISPIAAKLENQTIRRLIDQALAL